MSRISFEFSHTELALLIGALARSQAELELLTDHFMKDLKNDMEQLLLKLESRESKKALIP